eukprot:CAMPEP_0185786104 /NCGR_PEP_ID=MMETSP1174-20130828/133546_1 /TAXON_ID=35687 /ORGANISM="Dictyocha speculum, Strain CCMP1381" /LENGTH=37 /DNA_ID= /DNA_START= /DNA_END= /DNA_ORIENTATION=
MTTIRKDFTCGRPAGATTSFGASTMISQFAWLLLFNV